MTARCRGLGLLAWAIAVIAASSATATPIALPGFPLKAEGAVRQAVALADVDRDGSMDVVVQHGNLVSVFSSDIRTLPGWPVDLAALTKKANLTVVGPPAVGDIDGDGKPDVALAISFGTDTDGLLLALKSDGKPLWQAPLTRGPGAGCSLVDLTGRHAFDVVIGTRAGQLIALNAHGLPVSGFPVSLGSPVTSTVSYGSLAHGQKPVLAVGASDGKVHVYSIAGQPVPGFPLVTHFAVSGAPAFGDLDDDGTNELVVASQDFSVYAVRADGSAVPGFPVSTQYRIYGGPALGDLDHDGKLDIVVASSDGKVYAWNNKGRAFPNFPVSAGSKLDRDSTVVLADSSRSGKDSIFVTSADGGLYGFDGTGALLDGFPLRIGKEGEAVSSPTIADLVPDESEELVVGKVGEVQGFRLDRSGTLPQSPLSWPAPSHDSARQGHVGPNPPRYRNPLLAPATPRRGEALKLSYDYYSLDGDPESGTRIRWSLNGQIVSEFDNLREIPAVRMKRGDRWKATVQSPADFALFKDGPGSTIVATTEAAVGNSPPSAAKIGLEPAAVNTTTPVKVKILAPAVDPDGDAVSYTYRWEREGQVVSTQPTLESGRAHKGERWRVVVTPTDGDQTGPEAKLDFVIGNSIPTAPQIALTPAAPTIEDDISVTLVKPAVDADSDQLTYRYAFWVNGQRRALPVERALLPKGIARHGDVVKVEVWVTDGEFEGPHASAEVRVVNAAPKAPQVAIAPATPHTRDVLTAGLVTPARDPEHDPVQYRIRWFRDGVAFGALNQLTIPASEVHKGQRWTVEFVPSDGVAEGPVGKAEVTVVNTPPTRPRLAATNPTPAVTEPSAITIAEEATDPDGDPIHYEFVWSVDGKPAFATAEKPAALGSMVGKTSLAPGEFKKNQRILVLVTAVDIDGARGPVGTFEILPKNTPPGAPKVALEPAVPTIETGLHATIAAASEDKDGDQIVYHYRWFRDGVEAKEVGDRPQLKANEVKHGEEWRVLVTPFDGEAGGAQASAKAVIRNVAPVAPQIALGPVHPTVVTGLSCDVKQPATDADSDPLTLEYRWFRDGQPFSLPSTAASVAGEALRAGQSWKCEVVAHDQDATSPVAVAQAQVENAVPSLPTVVLDPRVPKAGEGVVCAIAGESVDPDGDRVTYEYHWEPPAGVRLPVLDDPARLPAGLVKRGQSWRCSVTVLAGQHRTTPVVAEATIGNTPPRPPQLALPAEAGAGSEIHCAFASEPADVDGDRLTYAFTWYRNGAPQSFAPTSAEVPGRLVKPGDRWVCSVVVNDGSDVSAAARSNELSVDTVGK